MTLSLSGSPGGCQCWVCARIEGPVGGRRWCQVAVVYGVS